MIDQVLGVGVVYVIGLAYLLPSLLAARRRHPQLASLLLRNVVWGWTVIVWAACLAAVVRNSQSSAPGLGAPSREQRAWDSVPLPSASLQSMSRAGLS